MIPEWQGPVSWLIAPELMQLRFDMPFAQQNVNCLVIQSKWDVDKLL
jgi:hypothetical protein